MKNSREYFELKKTLGPTKKNPKQINKLFEADCEIIKQGPKNFLTTSIDSVGEEIDLGLYKHVETWAWMAVMSSVSDLAASGSNPIGLTLSAQWKFGTEKKLQKDFYKALNLACKKANVAFLGGDTGNGLGHSFTSSILGESKQQPLMRTKARAGDYLVLAHQKKVGIGPALAYRFLMNAPEEVLRENLFRPTPSWELSHSLATYASAAIDTSDGIATSVFILSELNGLGAELYWDQKINHPAAQAAIKTLGLSDIFLWLGDHGDFQTMFVIPEKNIKKIPLSSNLSIIGQLTKKKKDNYQMDYNGQKISLPIHQITECPRDVASYAKLIKDMQSYLINL